MRKQIDIPDDKVKALKKLAIDAGLNFKAWCESIILKQLK
jgi:hypothetical protein